VKKFKIILIISLLATFLDSRAQTTLPCQDFDISTNPENPKGLPTATIGGNTLRILDWLQASWDWQTQNIGPNTIISNPFLASGNPNVQLVINANPANTDNQPIDGWELLAYNDGSKYDGVYVWRPSDYDFPYLLLYNKQRAIIRAFILYNLQNVNQDYDIATLSLRYFQNDVAGTLQPAVLSNFGAIQRPIDNYEKKTHAQTANSVSINTHQWLFADFPVAYDPCVCNFTYSKMYLSVDLVDKANVNLDGTTKTLEVAPATSTTFKPGLGLAGGSEIGKDLTKSFKGFKDDKELVQNTINLFGDQAKGGDKENYLKIGSLPKELSAILNVAGDVIPYFGLALSLYDNFTTDSKTEKPTQVVFSAKTELDGAITHNQNNAISIFMKVPGSLAPGNLLDEEKPLYDEPLGVMNLANTPELEYIDYYTHYDGFGDFTGFTGGLSSNTGDLPNDYQPFIRQYKIKTVPKVVINPSADLELVDLRYTVRVGYLAHPSNKNTIFDKSFNTMVCWATNESFSLSTPSPINMENFYDYSGFHVHDNSVSSGSAPHFITVKPFPLLDLNLPGPTQFKGYNIDVDKKMKKLGLAYENWPKSMPYANPLQNVRGYINTNYLPYSWMPFQTFYTYSGVMITESKKCGNTVHLPSSAGAPIFELKVQGIFSRKSDPTGELIAHSIVYPLSLLESSLNKDVDGTPKHTCTYPTGHSSTTFTLNANGVSNTTVWQDPLRIPFDIKLENETVGPGDVSALHNLTIGDNVNILPGTNFYAGNSISVEGTNTQIPPQSILAILPSPIGVTPLKASEYLLIDATSLCSDKKKYNAVVPSNKQRPTISFASKPASQLLAIYPNPTSELFTLFPSLISNFSTLRIFDVTGKLVSTYNTPQQTYSVADLASGTYFVELVLTDNTRTTQKLIVQRD
jgi:hypothetical protein